MVVDDDTFPTNRYRQQIKTGRHAEISPWGLMLQYFTMNLQDKNLHKAFWRNALSDQLSNLEYFVHVYLGKLLVDMVLNPLPGQDLSNPHQFVIILLVVGFIPHVILWLLDRAKAERRIQGLAINRLQANLLRKYLNYGEGARSIVSTSDLSMAITRDVPELVEMGFLTFFHAAKKFGFLLALMGLALSQMEGNQIYFAACTFVGYPAIMVLFLLTRQRGSAMRQDKLFKAQTDILSFIQSTIDSFRTIADYFQRPFIVVGFTKTVIECNKASTSANMWEVTNKCFSPALSALVVAAYTYAFYSEVRSGRQSLGVFLVGVSIWKQIGACYQEIYEDLRHMQKAMAPLFNIVYYMNLPIDIPRRMPLSRRNQSHGLDALALGVSMQYGVQKERVEAFSTHYRTMLEEMTGSFGQKGFDYAVDFQHIVAQNVTFVYPTCTGGGPKVLDSVSFRIPQGKLVAVCGPRGSGKSTVLSLISGIIIPTATPDDDEEDDIEEAGDLFLPPHLRILNVCSEPQTIHDLNLFDNICFGPSDGQDEHPERVRAICKRLGMTSACMEMLEDQMLSAEADDDVIMPTGVARKAPSLSFDSKQLRKSKVVKMAHKSDLQTDSEGATSAMNSDVPQVGCPRSAAKRKMQTLKVQSLAQLSMSDKVRMHLARALVMNPEVLVLHKPMAHFDEEHRQHVMNLLRDYVDCRGVEKSPEEFAMRRPRTCIFSVSTHDVSEMADIILNVDGGRIDQLDTKKMNVIRDSATKLFRMLRQERDSYRNSAITEEQFRTLISQVPYGKELLGIDDDYDRFSVFSSIKADGNGKVNFDDMLSAIQLHFRANLESICTALCALGPNEKHGSRQSTLNWWVPKVPGEGRPLTVSSSAAKIVATAH
eukprot:TRINITY_DN22256_c0_g1_i1.p1 TRINITY_DN22256_c0_g1~~TRINITY_DN22256_c0_g1_i1.p1  ORF type:complete len:1018 (-),score=208.61 TRINITY_DN22256_c0_g1_i1:56-2692(-)